VLKHIRQVKKLLLGVVASQLGMMVG